MFAEEVAGYPEVGLIMCTSSISSLSYLRYKDRTTLRNIYAAENLLVEGMPINIGATLS